MNPLFADDPEDKNSYLLPRPKQIEPLPPSGNPAVDMLRHKLDALYQHEPNAKQEMSEVEESQPPRSKHQQFMHQLTTSGRSMAEIQTAWHNYYTDLSDNEKHEVWQEFYQANASKRASHASQPHRAVPAASTNEIGPIFGDHTTHPVPTDDRSMATIKQTMLKRLQTSHSAQQKAKQHLQSLAFGLGLGALALLIALFGLFNELVITPFIRPGSAAATPIILSTDGPAPSSTPQVIIPKLNAQLPAIYDQQYLSEEEVQKTLESGVYHYPTTATPGENGNIAIFGHSSNNIFNKGKYKFAFVLLHEMEPGDIFYLTYNNKVYTYKVFTKKVVNPNETWVLTSTEGKTATAALITCDPPGSTRHRLVVWGEQVNPDPSANSGVAAPSPALQTQELPGKGPSALIRLWHTVNPFD